MQKSNVRHIPNPYFLNWGTVVPPPEQIYRIFLDRLLDFSTQIRIPSLIAISCNQKQNFTSYDMFQGSGSYLYLYLKLYKFFKSAKQETVDNFRKSSDMKDEIFFKLSDSEYYLKAAIMQYEESIKFIEDQKIKNKSKDKKQQITFCFSKYSIYLCGVHLAYITKNPKQFKQNLKSLLQGYDYITKNRDDLFCEILYGIPGYLIMLLELYNQYKHIGMQNSDYEIDVIKEVSKLVDIIISKGIKAYEKITNKKVDITKELPKDFRLVYLFYDKQYLGGAHGLGGVLNILLLSYQLFSVAGFSKDLNKSIKITCYKSVEFLLKNRYNNNFSSSVKKQLTQNRLVQFCHGNPGILTPLLHFCQLFSESSKQLGLNEVIINHMNKIWQQGLLKKGYYGLCHGISGNAYTFISPVFHRVLPTYNEEFKRKAQLFWILQEDQNIRDQINNFQFDDRFVQNVADYPYSLMGGTAGDLCFAMDLIRGEGCFPGFDL